MRLTFTVHSSVVEQVRQIAATWPAGGGMFQRPATDGQGTYYASSGWITPDIAGILPYSSWDFDGDQWVETTHHTLPDGSDKLTALAAHLEIPLQQAQALFAAVDISDQPWEEAFSRLGLELVPDQE